MVLNWYGNFEKPIVYTYFHIDVTNLHDLVIVIVMLERNLVNFHKDISKIKSI